MSPSPLTQVAIPVMQGEEGLLVITAGMVAGLDEERSVLAGVLAFVQIFPANMSVIPAEAGRVGREGVVDLGAGRNGRSAFFHGAVDL